MSALGIQLTTIGSRIRVDVEPAALEEATGGVQLRLHLHDGPLALTLTPGEARWLTAALAGTVDGDGA